MTKGRRLYLSDPYAHNTWWLDPECQQPEGGIPFKQLQNGDYWRHPSGWYGMSPTGALCNLAGHTILEHLDGTISASPSIWVDRGRSGSWHGFIEHGLWRECSEPQADFHC